MPTFQKIAARAWAGNGPSQDLVAPACATGVGPPATSAIVPIRTRRGAFQARAFGAGICWDLDMECSAMGIYRISILEANYLKPCDKNSPKMLQCERERIRGFRRVTVSKVKGSLAKRRHRGLRPRTGRDGVFRQPRSALHPTG